MSLIRIPRGWELPERLATPEAVYLNRRKFFKQLGVAGLGLVAGSSLLGAEEDAALYPAKRNPAYTLDRALTAEGVASSYNNFYEFTTDKEAVREKVADFRPHPWQVEIRGLVNNPKVWDFDELVRKLPLEERLYRHRCVEAWAMAVPWTGFPLKALVELAQPLSGAKYLRLVSFYRPDEAPGQKWQPWYSWPYYEGLSMAEATNELTLIATGIYGHELPKQHGAPLRLVTPWKYGFKSIKSIVLIDFVAAQPPTFWHTANPDEYDFVANVNPGIPHPRWSQATEQLIGTNERVPTQLYNGYGEYVARLYS